EFRIEARERVSGAVVDEVGRRVVRARLPHAAAADAPGIVVILPGLRAGLARCRNGERTPGELTAVDVPGADPAACACLPTGAFALQHEFLAAAGLDGERSAGDSLRLGCRRAGCRIGGRL